MSRVKTLSLALLTLSLCTVSALPGQAQNAPNAGQPPANGGKTALTERLFSLNFDKISIREALKTLFTNAGVDFSIDSQIGDSTVSVKVADQPLDQALRILLRSSDRPLTYERTGNLYMVKVRPEETAPALPLRTMQFPLLYQRPGPMMLDLQPRFSRTDFIPQDSEHSLIVRTDEDSIMQIRDLIRLLDVKPREFVVKAEVVLATSNEKKEKGNALLSTIIRTTAGNEALGEDKTSGTPAQTSKISLRVKVYPLGDGFCEVESHWEISVPLSADGTTNKPASLVRLEKTMSNTTRMRPGDTKVVGGSVLLRQYGLSGEILFFLTLTPVDDTPAPVGGGVKP